MTSMIGKKEGRKGVREGGREGERQGREERSLFKNLLAHNTTSRQRGKKIFK
jgi:hypothetical protein